MLAFRIRDPLWHASAMSPGSKLKRAKKSQIKKNLTFLGHLACSDVTIGRTGKIKILPIFKQTNEAVPGSTDYGRTMKLFFIETHNFWAWADKLGT